MGVNMSNVPVDVTDQLRAAGYLTGPDFNDHDRVYELDGVRVKVKTFREVVTQPAPSPVPGVEALPTLVDVFRFSGSEVGEDGKALTRDGRPAICLQPDHLTVQADAEVDLVREVELKRFECVRRVVRWTKNHRAALGLTGVGVRQA